MDKFDDKSFTSTPPSSSNIEIYLSTSKNQPALIFCVGGEILLTVSRDKFEAKGLTPIKTSEELYELMLDFFQRGKK